MVEGSLRWTASAEASLLLTAATGLFGGLELGVRWGRGRTTNMAQDSCLDGNRGRSQGEKKRHKNRLLEKEKLVRKVKKHGRWSVSTGMARERRADERLAQVIMTAASCSAVELYNCHCPTPGHGAGAPRPQRAFPQIRPLTSPLASLETGNLAQKRNAPHDADTSKTPFTCDCGLR